MSSPRISPTPTRRSLMRSVARGCLLGLGLASAAEAGRVLVGGNFHVVVPGRVYRCAQPSPGRLEHLIRTYGIRTVVNLRGTCLGNDWYHAQARVTAALDVCQEDLCFSAGRLPSVPEVRRLVEVLDRCDTPILMHCQRGADRTVLAAAVAVLLRGESSYEEGRRLLGPRFGHVALGRPVNLDRFFGLYERRLAERKQAHSPDAFRRWLVSDYRPGPCWCEITLLAAPDHVRPREPFACRVRCRNTSGESWRFQAGNNAGMHVNFVVADAEGVKVANGKGGLFDAEVGPGESIDITLPVPGLPGPGRYLLVADMAEEQHCNFFQVGSEPLEWEFEVREEGATR